MGLIFFSFLVGLFKSSVFASFHGITTIGQHIAFTLIVSLTHMSFKGELASDTGPACMAFLCSLLFPSPQGV